MGFSISEGKGNSKPVTNTSTSSTTTQSTSNTVDNRVAEGAGAVLGGNTSLNLNQSDVAELVINQTDLGAVMGGLGLATHALDSVLEGASRVLESADKTQKTQTSLVDRAFSLADSARQSETSGAIQNTLKYGAIIVGLAILAFAAVKLSKK